MGDVSLAPARAQIACRVGCPAQAYVPALHRTCGGHVHAEHFCFFVRGPQAVPIQNVQDLQYHECEGCRGDHIENQETGEMDRDA